MMPLLFSLGQHALFVPCKINWGTFVCSHSWTVCGWCVLLIGCLRFTPHCKQSSGGTYGSGCMMAKPKSGTGVRPLGCDILDRAARAVNPDHTTVWRGSVDAPTHEQGITVLGTPLGHDDFIRAHLKHIMQEHAVLLEQIPSVPDTESAWALLLHCANATANCCLQVVRPNVAEDFAHAHNAGLWQCLSDILGVSPDQCDRLSRDPSSLPLSMGGLGLQNPVRTSVPAFWASWADSLQMVHERHPVVAERIVGIGGRGQHSHVACCG